MPVKAVQQAQSDRIALLALAYTTLAVFTLLLLRAPDPALFLPVGIAALPFAASKRHALRFYASAVLLLLVFIVLQGVPVGIAFVPTAAALLLAAALTGARREQRGKRRSRRSR